VNVADKTKKKKKKTETKNGKKDSCSHTELGALGRARGDEWYREPPESLLLKAQRGDRGKRGGKKVMVFRGKERIKGWTSRFSTHLERPCEQ